MRKLAVLSISICLALSFGACGSSGQQRPSEAREIDVVGLTMKDAYKALAAEGWDVEAVLDEDRERSGSGGMPISEARNDTRNVVTRVEFSPSEQHPTDRTLRSVPTCMIYYKSGGQDRLEEDYGHQLTKWESDYTFYLQWRESGESPDSLREAVQQWYQEVILYEPGNVPDSYKAAHDQMVARVSEFLSSLG
jgi:hypothetical protein